MAASDAPAVSQAPQIRDRAVGIIATAAVLALLYFARDVLVPITLAFILSLLIAPLVRALRRIGLGQTLSVVGAVLVLALSLATVAGVIGTQLMRMSTSLPKYERTLERKLETLNNVTLKRVNALTTQAGRVLNKNVDAPPPRGLQPVTAAATAAPQTPIPVEVHEAPANSLQLIQKVL